MDKRINILFDHLNNQDLLSEGTIAMLVEISRAVQGKEWDRAQAVFGDLQREKSEEGGVWIVSPAAFSFSSSSLLFFMCYLLTNSLFV